MSLLLNISDVWYFTFSNIQTFATTGTSTPNHVCRYMYSELMPGWRATNWTSDKSQAFGSRLAGLGSWWNHSSCRVAELLALVGWLDGLGWHGWIHVFVRVVSHALRITYNYNYGRSRWNNAAVRWADGGNARDYWTKSWAAVATVVVAVKQEVNK